MPGRRRRFGIACWLGGKILLCFEMYWKAVESVFCFDKLTKCALVFILDLALLAPMAWTAFPCHGCIATIQILLHGHIARCQFFAVVELEPDGVSE